MSLGPLEERSEKAQAVIGYFNNNEARDEKNITAHKVKKKKKHQNIVHYYSGVQLIWKWFLSLKKSRASD